MEDITDVIDKITSVITPSHLFYFFSDDFVEKYPEYFYKKDDNIYAKWDNTEIKKYPKYLNSDNSQEYIYIIPVEEMKPIKIIYEEYIYEEK